MISEELQEQSIAYLWGELSPAEASLFKEQCGENAELAAFVKDMRETLSRLAETSPVKSPSPALRERVLAIPRRPEEPVPVPQMDIPIRSARHIGRGWMMAACILAILVAASIYDDWNQRNRSAGLESLVAATSHDLESVRKQVEAQQQEIASLQGRDIFSNVQVASLASQSAPYQQASAVVIWDRAKQQGLVRLTGLPRIDSNKVYQLWVIDAGATGPISAGLLPVTSNGGLQQAFRPVGPVGSAQKFAISVEDAGGSTQPKGPIVLIGG